MHELKPCPFCGGVPIIQGGKFLPEPQFDAYGEFIGMGTTLESEIEPTYIECVDCHVTTSSYDETERAVEAWNRRAEDVPTL